MTTPPSLAADLAQVAGAAPERILAWAAERFPGRVAFASSLGIEDQVVVHHIATAGLPIPVFTLDTGRLFPETYDLIAATRERYGLPIRVYSPEAAAVETLVNEHGVDCYRQSVDLRKTCCGVRKLQPLKRALAGLEAWICGLRRGQGPTRAEVQELEWDAGNRLIKINPLAGWDAERVRAFALEHGVPVNPLHARGFPSIGCACCTRAIEPGEDERAGRWWWELPEQKECGLHFKDGKLVRAKTLETKP